MLAYFAVNDTEKRWAEIAAALAFVYVHQLVKKGQATGIHHDPEKPKRPESLCLRQEREGWSLLKCDGASGAYWLNSMITLVRSQHEHGISDSHLLTFSHFVML